MLSPPPASALSRRTAVRLGAGGLAAALAARGPSRAAAQTEPATFVLVHGAWAGAWIWRDVIRLLRAAGHDVHATTATGLGDRAHLADAALDLDLYVTDVVNVLEYEDLRGVTLVGHSFGGMTITGVAEQVPERLAQLVYLDAVVPADGEDFYAAALFPAEVRAAAAAAAEAAGTPGFDFVDQEFVRALTPDPADQEWLLAKLVPQPLATYTQPVRLGNPAAAALPRAFILCTQDPLESATRISERLRSDPGWRVVELADNHLAPVNDPQATAEALLSLV